VRFTDAASCGAVERGGRAHWALREARVERRIRRAAPPFLMVCICIHYAVKSTLEHTFAGHCLGDASLPMTRRIPLR
jgi:hypothetical protein